VTNTGTAAAPVPKSLTVQAFWLMIARTVGFVCGLALPIILARVFSKDQFGTYRQVFVLVNTSVVMLTFNFSISAYYFLPRRPEKSNAVVLHNLLYHAVAGLLPLLVLVLYPDFLHILSSGEVLRPFSHLIGVVIAAWIFSSLLEQLATAGSDVRASTTFIVGSQLTKTFLLVGAGVMFRTVEAVVWAALIQCTLQGVTLIWYAQRRYPGLWSSFDKAMLIDQIRFVIPTGITGVLYAFQADLHNYIVANQFSPAEYAIYAVGTTQIPFIGILRDSINTVMLPRVAKLQQEGATAEILRIMLKAWRKTGAGLLPIFALLLLLRTEFITVLYGRAYMAASPIFAINLLLLLLTILVTDAVARAHIEINVWMIRVRLLSLAVQVVSSLVLIRFFGMTGALLGMAAGFVVERAVSVRVILGILDFRWHDLRELGGLAGFAVCSGIAAACAAAVLAFIPAHLALARLVAGGAIFVCAYVAAVIAMKLPDEQETAVMNAYSLRFLRMRIL
jgi:O-antigen/teichoic acid export membrane protein